MSTTMSVEESKAKLMSYGSFLGLTLTEDMSVEEMNTLIKAKEESSTQSEPYTVEDIIVEHKGGSSKVSKPIEESTGNVCAICKKKDVSEEQAKFSKANFGVCVCWKCQRTDTGKELKDEYKKRFKVHEAANRDVTCYHCGKSMNDNAIKWSKANRVPGLEDHYICYSCNKEMTKPKKENNIPYECYECHSILNPSEVEYNKKNKVKGLEKYCFCTKHHPKAKQEKQMKKLPLKKVYCTFCPNRELTKEEIDIYVEALRKNKEKLINIPLCPNCIKELEEANMLVK